MLQRHAIDSSCDLEYRTVQKIFVRNLSRKYPPLLVGLGTLHVIFPKIFAASSISAIWDLEINAIMRTKAAYIYQSQVSSFTT